MPDAAAAHNGRIKLVGPESERVQLAHVGATEEQQDFIDSLGANLRTLLYISDELRGPLALFQGYLSMVEDGDLPIHQALPILLGASRDMNKKLSRLLLEARELTESS